MSCNTELCLSSITPGSDLEMDILGFELMGGDFENLKMAPHDP